MTNEKKCYFGFFPNQIHTSEFDFNGTNNYRNEILKYLKCNNNEKKFIEGNIMILKKLKGEGVSLIISSHALDDIKSLCDRVLVLEKTKLIEDGPTIQVLERLNQKYQSSEPWDEDPMEGELS